MSYRCGPNHIQDVQLTVEVSKSQWKAEDLNIEIPDDSWDKLDMCQQKCTRGLNWRNQSWSSRCIRQSIEYSGVADKEWPIKLMGYNLRVSVQWPAQCWGKWRILWVIGWTDGGIKRRQWIGAGIV